MLFRSEYENLQKTDNTFFESTFEKFDVIETETEVKIDFFNKQIIFDRNTGKRDSGVSGAKGNVERFYVLKLIKTCSKH